MVEGKGKGRQAAGSQGLGGAGRKAGMQGRGRGRRAGMGGRHCRQVVGRAELWGRGRREGGYKEIDR